MIETLFFLLIQLILNLSVKGFGNTRLTYIFTSLAYIFFILGLMLYPYVSGRISDLIYPSDSSEDWRCGNAQLGAVMFQYVMGGLLVVILQRFYNSRLHKT